VIGSRATATGNAVIVRAHQQLKFTNGERRVRELQRFGHHFVDLGVNAVAIFCRGLGMLALLLVVIVTAACANPPAGKAGRATPTPSSSPNVQHNLSGNPYFPVVVGATWTYATTTNGKTGSLTITIVSASAGADGEDVAARVTTDQGSATETYVLKANGDVEIKGLQSGGASLASSNETGTVIPPADQLTVGAAWDSGGQFTGSLPGFSQTIPESYSTHTTVAAIETQAVEGRTVNALRLDKKTVVTGPLPGQPIETSMTEQLWLARDIGIVRTSSTASVKVAGISHGTEGTSVLTSFNIPT